MMKNILKVKFCNNDTRANVCGSTKEFCSCVHMYEFKVNELVEFILVDEATMSESHPVIK